MEDELIMNRLPLPKYYDGKQWNTVLLPTRKSIPKYLHSDLPELSHIYIKEKFKEIGKFNCPKLQYFDKMIKHKKPVKEVEKKKDRKKDKEVTYNQIKDQLQYALIMTDKNSNVIDNLLEQAKSVKKRSFSEAIPRKKKQKKSINHKFFDNTVELVFKQRKRQFLSQLGKKQEPDLSEVEGKINSIKLLDFD